MGVLIAPHPHQHLVWSVISNLAISWGFVCFNTQQFRYLLASFLPRGNKCSGLQGIRPDYTYCASEVNSGLLTLQNILVWIICGLVVSLISNSICHTPQAVHPPPQMPSLAFCSTKSFPSSKRDFSAFLKLFFFFCYNRIVGGRERHNVVCYWGGRSSGRDRRSGPDQALMISLELDAAMLEVKNYYLTFLHKNPKFPRFCLS